MIPNIANATQELSKVNGGMNSAAFHELLHIIRYVHVTKNLGLKLESSGDANKPWAMVCYCNIGYNHDPISRRSVSGFILDVSGVTISWQSKAQRSMSLSISEAEWVVLSETLEEVTFMIQPLEGMKISVKLPVMVRVDNIGSIFNPFMQKESVICTLWAYIQVHRKS